MAHDERSTHLVIVPIALQQIRVRHLTQLRREIRWCRIVTSLTDTDSAMLYSSSVSRDSL
jgi:hypothetical protein